jgi:signal transduction histidine kinase
VKNLTPSDHLDLKRVVAGYRRQALVAIQSAFLCGATIIFILCFANSSAMVLSSIGLSMALSAVSLICALKENSKFASYILAIQFIFSPTYLAYLSLGTFDSAMMIIPAGLIAISVVVKPKAMAIFSVLMLLAAGFVATATWHGTIGNPAFYPQFSTDPVDIIVSLVVIFFSGIVATYVSSVLSSLLHKLAEYQYTLEEQVERRTLALERSNVELQQAMERLDLTRAELVRGEKLAGLGSLVAGVAHELNTPIGNTAMVASTLQDQVAEFSKIIASGKVLKSDIQLVIQRITEGAELLMRSTHRARDLVSSFKQVAVDQTSERRREFRLDEVVNDVLSTMRPSFHGVMLKSEVQADIVCNGYPGPLGQLLTNLIQNAVLHGIGENSDGLVQVLCKSLNNEEIQILVEDNGKGMDDETLNKIFDPFFTTRLGQGGSGLGLTIVHNIATGMLGGSITVESRIGEGTRFFVTLPKTTPERH